MGCRGSSPAVWGQRRVVAPSPGRPAGQHGHQRSCPSQDNLQPRRTDFRAPNRLRTLHELCSLLEHPVSPPSLPFFLSFSSLLGSHSLQKASLMPQSWLSASSGSPPGLCLLHSCPDHRVVTARRHVCLLPPLDCEPYEVWICFCHCPLQPLLADLVTHSRLNKL